jgi:hypothetical protein
MDQTGVIPDTYTDIKQTLAWLHNLHGHQLPCCPKAGDMECVFALTFAFASPLNANLGE